MTYKGKIVDGAVVLEPPVPLVNGTDVNIQIEPAASSADTVMTAGEFLMQFAGIIDDPTLPTDASINLDHYLYRTPMK